MSQQIRISNIIVFVHLNNSIFSENITFSYPLFSTIREGVWSLV
jgi:hypothetical protein